MALALGVSLTGCASRWRAAAPVGTTGKRVPSRYQGEPLAILGQPAAPVAATAAATGQVTHVVQKGDTLWNISQRHGTTVQELMALNGIERPEDLALGARLLIPGGGRAGDGPKRPLARATPAPPPPRARGVLVDGGSRSHYPLRWPIDGEITSRFGHRSGRPHDGIDIGAPKGTQVHAAADGDVLFSDEHGGYGNLVVLRHSGGLITVYAHHEINLVRKGQRVLAGQAIARVGTTGRATGPHLHFEVRRGTRPENPLHFLPP